MLVRLLTTFIFLSVSGSSALACTTISLDKNRIGPIHDQQGSGICYAFTAADLFSYKTGKKVSATGLAASYYIAGKVTLKYKASSGGVAHAMDLASKAGLCLESEMSSKNPKLIFDTVNDLVEKKDNACEDIKDTLTKVFPKASVMDLIKAVNQNTDHYNKAMASLIINGCKNWFRYHGKVKDIVYTKRTNLLKDALYSYKNNYNPLKEIDAQLDKKNLVAVSIPDFKKFARAIGTGHSVSIVGRKKDPKTNRCMYQVRNSWGKSCHFYHKKFQNKCKDGYFWVDSNDLYNPKTYELNVRRVTYIEK